MIAIDTNVIVRLLTRDDEAQYQAAYSLFQKEQIFIPKTVVLETEWVLRYAYEFSADKVVETLTRLLGLRNVESEDSQSVAIALDWHAQGLDFADALHLASSQQADSFATFDQRLLTQAPALSATSLKAPESSL